MQHLHAPLPSQQHAHQGLPELTEHELHRRREGVFLLLSGLFLGTLAMLNILGITRFIKLFELDLDASTPGTTAFAVAVGVIPYPLTFLCTDFISELYGRRRASAVVWVGLILNIWVVAVLWLGGTLPGFGALDAQTGMPPLPEWDPEKGAYIETGWTFYQVRTLAFGAVAASMVAYLVAQLVDVHVFHFWKRLTRGKHLWIRNNGSTVVSQLVDTSAVILITHFYAHALPIDEDQKLWAQLMLFIVTGYVYKLLSALIDTVPFMIGTKHMVRYLRLPPPGHTEAPDSAP